MLFFYRHKYTRLVCTRSTYMRLHIVSHSLLCIIIQLEMKFSIASMRHGRIFRKHTQTRAGKYIIKLLDSDILFVHSVEDRLANGRCVFVAYVCASSHLRGMWLCMCITNLWSNLNMKAEEEDDEKSVWKCVSSSWSYWRDLYYYVFHSRLTDNRQLLLVIPHRRDVTKATRKSDYMRRRQHNMSEWVNVCYAVAYHHWLSFVIHFRFLLFFFFRHILCAIISSLESLTGSAMSVDVCFFDNRHCYIRRQRCRRSYSFHFVS